MGSYNFEDVAYIRNSAISTDLLASSVILEDKLLNFLVSIFSLLKKYRPGLEFPCKQIAVAKVILWFDIKESEPIKTFAPFSI